VIRVARKSASGARLGGVEGDTVKVMCGLTQGSEARRTLDVLARLLEELPLGRTEALDGLSQEGQCGFP
jgi:hypothetical protein